VSERPSPPVPIVVVVADGADDGHIEKRPDLIVYTVIPRRTPECNVSGNYREIYRHFLKPSFAVNGADQFERSAVVEYKAGVIIAQDYKFEMVAFVRFELIGRFPIRIWCRVGLKI